MVFTREKNDTSNQNRERCFFTCEKNDTSNQKPQRCASFAPKFSPFIAACSAASHTFKEKSFTQRVFPAKKVKNISEMEWNRFVCFTVDEENGREPAKQQRKGNKQNQTIHFHLPNTQLGLLVNNLVCLWPELCSKSILHHLRWA